MYLYMYVYIIIHYIVCVDILFLLLLMTDHATCLWLQDYIRIILSSVHIMHVSLAVQRRVMSSIDWPLSVVDYPVQVVRI